LQQEASRKWRMGAKQTMRIAQNLYENGLITYMRTDSTNLATVAIDAARRLIREQYGNEYLPSAPRFYSSKVKNAQEAHEAIRPAGAMELPENLRGRLEDDQFKLYDLIWKRTIACQMENARVRRTTVVLEADGARFQTSGKTIDFPGYLRAYVEGTDDPDAELADKEKVLPPLVVGEQLSCKAMDPKSHTTQPPPRYTEATLTRDLEGRGIGRPSTYASILDTILSRDYVFKKGQALVPTWTAFGVVNLLEKYLPSIVDYEFTARMEDDLDAISRGEAAHIAYLKNFYFGNDNSGLKPQIELQREGIDPRVVSGITIGTPEGGEEIQVRIGKFGPYLKQGERSASVPPDLAPDELDVTKALAILYAAKQGDEPLGYDPESGKPIYMKAGRFGPYVQMGDTGGDEKPKNSSLLKGMKPEDVDLDTALRLLSLPRTLGTFPATGEPVEAANGKFGPYVRSGKEYRSLPADLSPIDVTYDQAMALLSQPKVNRRGAASAPREPMRAFPESPVTGSPIQLFEGRYGPYVTDGETNASLPKDANPADLTFAEALNLLAARAAAGGGKKKKKAAKKKAPAASDAPKTAAKKKAA
ncbi:MAG TPA: DNA topoisomerase, partial [Pirellulales bacterium]